MEAKNASLLQTLEEVLPPNEAMTIHALITARFAVIEKAGKTADGLPVLILYRDSVNTSGLLPKSYALKSGASILDCRQPLNIHKQMYDEASEDED